LAFERIINVPKRGLGASTIQQLQELARYNDSALLPVTVAAAQNKEFRPAVRQTFEQLARQFSHWRSLAANIPPWELAQIVLDESGYTAMLLDDKTPEAQGKLENLKELVAAMREFETLEGFLEHVGLVLDMAGADDVDKVTIMTLHAAKGLEFELVFLPGWEEGIFPNTRAIEENGGAGLEEERRLAYVGLTRARHQAIITYARSRRLYNQWQYLLPSRFLKELPAEHIERVGGGHEVRMVNPVSALGGY
jgi:DNA helicase-2/ATP-dependent DNA helicase PcrA